MTRGQISPWLQHLHGYTCNCTLCSCALLVLLCTGFPSKHVAHGLAMDCNCQLPDLSVCICTYICMQQVKTCPQCRFFSACQQARSPVRLNAQSCFVIADGTHATGRLPRGHPRHHHRLSGKALKTSVLSHSKVTLACASAERMRYVD